MHIILIDYENVQPKNLVGLKNHPVRVMVFVGANQAKVPFDLAESLQALGKNAEYVKVSGSGRNALDFHIAYYLGELAQAKDVESFFIVSRDTGFDPLVRHLGGRGIKLKRVRDLAELPFLQIPVEKPDDEKIKAIVRNLVGRGQSRPRKLRTLANSINSQFAKKLSDAELDRLIGLLKNRGVVRVKNGNVSYKLPKSS